MGEPSLHHLTRRCEGAELDCEKMRRQLERALAEAEAAQAETEAYKMEMDANVDRIERAAQIAEECAELRERLRLTEASRERERERRGGLQATAAAAEERATNAVEEARRDPRPRARQDVRQVPGRERGRGEGADRAEVQALNRR